MSAKIDFWFSIGSTYTALSVLRMADVESATGAGFTFRPFDVRTIMSEVGNRPFTGKPVKMKYMWRDIERRSRKYGMSLSLPAPYPLPELERANQVAEYARRNGWCRDYVHLTYERWFKDGLEPGSERHLREVLEAVGQDPARVVEAATGPEGAAALAQATDEARALGIFGSPCFLVDGELFWGDDRLEDALEWSAGVAG